MESELPVPSQSPESQESTAIVKADKDKALVRSVHFSDLEPEEKTKHLVMLLHELREEDDEVKHYTSQRIFTYMAAIFPFMLKLVGAMSAILIYSLIVDRSIIQLDREIRIALITVVVMLGLSEGLKRLSIFFEDRARNLLIEKYEEMIYRVAKEDKNKGGSANA